MSKEQKWIKQLEVRRKAIGLERDKLCEAVSKMEDLQECCERAYDEIGYAIDALSELS